MRIGRILVIFVLLKISTFLVAAAFSTYRPLTEIEHAVHLWPPSDPYSLWAERAFVAPFERWDAIYYVKIAAQGYRLEDGTVAFYPLFPFIAKPLVWLGCRPLLSLMIVSSLATLFLLATLARLAELDHNTESAVASTILFVSFPIAFSLFVPYTEALFLLWTALCLLAMRQRRWCIAGIAAGLATLTRQQGILLAIPLAWELWDFGGRKLQTACRQWKNWLPLLLIPACLSLWAGYRLFVLNDWPPENTTPYALLKVLVLSPSTNKVAPQYGFMWPWKAFSLALKHLFLNPEKQLILDLSLAAVVIALAAKTWKDMATSYRLYVLAVFWVSLSDHTGSIYPYQGLPRHLFLALPVFLSYGTALYRPAVRLLTFAGGTVGMLFLLSLYVLHAWIP